MTRIMRVRIPVCDRKEWVSVLPAGDPEQVLVVRQNGDEVHMRIDAEQPLEPQISRALENAEPVT